jgi:hypothetical protein
VLRVGVLVHSLKLETCVCSFCYVVFSSHQNWFISYKTLITNKCTKRVLSSIVTHSYMFRPCWVILTGTFRYRYTKVALYSGVRMCCWLCTALFLEAWTHCGPGLSRPAGLQAGTAESSHLQYTVNSTFSLNYKVQPQCNGNEKFSLKTTQQGRNM